MAIPLHMDYDGQYRAEAYSRSIIVLFGAIGFIWGYYVQLFSQTVLILGVGFILSCIVSLPPWPIYRRKPIKWLKPRDKVVNDQEDDKKKKNKVVKDQEDDNKQKKKK